MQLTVIYFVFAWRCCAASMLLYRVVALDYLVAFITQSNMNELLFCQIIVIWVLGKSLKIVVFQEKKMLTLVMLASTED